jgi:hypothetical protein
MVEFLRLFFLRARTRAEDSAAVPAESGQPMTRRLSLRTRSVENTVHIREGERDTVGRIVVFVAQYFTSRNKYVFIKKDTRAALDF